MLLFLYLIAGIIVSILFSLRMFVHQRSAPSRILAATAAGCCFVGWVLFWPAVALAWVLDCSGGDTDTNNNDDRPTYN